MEGASVRTLTRHWISVVGPFAGWYSSRITEPSASQLVVYDTYAPLSVPSGTSILMLSEVGVVVISSLRMGGRVGRASTGA